MTEVCTLFSRSRQLGLNGLMQRIVEFELAKTESEETFVGMESYTGLSHLLGAFAMDAWGGDASARTQLLGVTSTMVALLRSAGNAPLHAAVWQGAIVSRHTLDAAVLS